ncbi:MAG: DMT family transporter [Betaproteobacteria bacterium]|nr:DMT family transporter [Betaproteobacteria bacterium]
MTRAASRTSDFSVHLRLFGMALLWGGSWPAGRVVATTMPALAASAWRFSLVVLVLGLWVWWRDRAWPRLTLRQWGALFVCGLVGVFGYAVFFLYAMQTVGAARAALVVTTNPVFTTLLAAWIFHESLNWKIGMGMVMATLGAAIVLTHGAPWKLLAGDITHGDALLLGCIACWVSYTLLGKALMKGVDPLTVTFCTALIGLLLFWPATLLVEGGAVWQGVPEGSRFALLFLALGSTVLAYVWYNQGIARLGAGVASSYISVVPVFGVLAATLLLGEPVDASLLVGGALAVAGVVWVNRSR